MITNWSGCEGKSAGRDITNGYRKEKHTNKTCCIENSERKTDKERYIDGRERDEKRKKKEKGGRGKIEEREKR